MSIVKGCVGACWNTIDKMAEHRIVNAFDDILSVSSKLVIESFHLIMVCVCVCVCVCVRACVCVSVLGEQTENLINTSRKCASAVRFSAVSQWTVGM